MDTNTASTQYKSALGGKTLLFTLEYPPFAGGVANYYFNLTKYYNRQFLPDHEIIVLDNSDQALINEKLPILKWLPASRALRKALKQNNVKHILVGHLLPLGTVTYYYSKFSKFNYSVFLHGMDLEFSQKSRRKKILAKKILDHADSIICTNTYVAELAGRIILNKNKIKIITPGIDQAACAPIDQEVIDLRSQYGLADKFILFSVNRLVKRKGADLVIGAVTQLSNQLPNLVYAIAGTGPDENYLKDLVNALPKNFKLHFIFLGKINDQAKWNWLKLCDAFIMPSRNIKGDVEGFGIVYLEANLAGKPVIAGDSGGVRDAVVDSLNGLLVNPESTDEISQAILSLASDAALCKKLGEQGRERVIRSFNWTNKIQQLFKIINH